MNPFEMMKNIKAIQEQMQTFQSRLPGLQVTGESGGGMVKVTMDGTFRVTRVELDQDIVDPKDREFLQDLVCAASTDAHTKMKELLAREMSGMAGMAGLNPAMFGM